MNKSWASFSGFSRDPWLCGLINSLFPTDRTVILSTPVFLLDKFFLFLSGLWGPVFSQEHLSAGRGREPQKWQRPESEKVPVVPVAILSQALSLRHHQLASSGHSEMIFRCGPFLCAAEYFARMTATSS